MAVTRRSPQLATVVYAFVALGAACAAAGAWMLVTQQLARFEQSALAQAVTTRGRGLALDFTRTLHQEWRNTKIIAEEIARRDPASVRSSLDLVVGDHDRVSWAGIAALDGTVTAASGGLLEGQNVGSRPWFQRGLEGDFAGDVHDAVLLAKLLPSETGEPRRFLDLATPIPGADGRTVGVLGLHIDFAWAREHLLETARTLELDAFLISSDGSIVVATDESFSGTLDLPSMRAAATGASRAAVETWPDGRNYLTTVIPQLTYSDLPSFGWSLVARIRSDALFGDAPSIWHSVAVFMLGFGAVLIVMTAVFVQLFIRPFRQLADSASSSLKGEERYPYESRSTAEAALLSAAVARLQTQRLNRKAPAREASEVA